MTRQSECENETAVLRLEKLTSCAMRRPQKATQRWCHCSPSLSDNCSQVTINCNKDSTRRVLTILTACSFIGDSCCVRSNSPTFLCLAVELLFHFLLLQSVLGPKEDLAFSCVSSHVLLHADPFNNVHLNNFSSFFMFALSSPFGCFHLRRVDRQGEVLMWTLPSLRIRIRFNILPYSLVPLSRILQAFSSPNQNVTLPLHSSYHIVASQMSLSPFPAIFDKYCGPVHVPGIFMCLLPHSPILVCFRTPLCSMFRIHALLFHEVPLYFWLWPQLLTFFPFLHQAVKAGCVPQDCAHFSLAGLALLSLPPRILRAALLFLPLPSHPLSHCPR